MKPDFVVSKALHTLELTFKTFKDSIGVQELGEEYKGPKSKDLQEAVIRMDSALENLAIAVEKAKKEYPKLYV